MPPWMPPRNSAVDLRERKGRACNQPPPSGGRTTAPRGRPPLRSPLCWLIYCGYVPDRQGSTAIIPTEGAGRYPTCPLARRPGMSPPSTRLGLLEQRRYPRVIDPHPVGGAERLAQGTPRPGRPNTPRRKCHAVVLPRPPCPAGTVRARRPAAPPRRAHPGGGGSGGPQPRRPDTRPWWSRMTLRSHQARRRRSPGGAQPRPPRACRPRCGTGHRRARCPGSGGRPRQRLGALTHSR